MCLLLEVKIVSNDNLVNKNVVITALKNVVGRETRWNQLLHVIKDSVFA